MSKELLERREATPDYQRYLKAAAEYVRLREELIQKQGEMDAVRAILGEYVPAGEEPLALLVRDSSVVVLVSHPYGTGLTIQVKPVIE